VYRIKKLKKAAKLQQWAVEQIIIITIIIITEHFKQVKHENEIDIFEHFIWKAPTVIFV
jgi:hypothetical protein